MKRLAIVLTCLPALLLAPLGARAQDEPAAGQTVHVVEAGETLGVIARRYYDDAARWRTIYEANRDVLSDPDALQVGMRLVIPGAGAEPAAAGLVGRPVDGEPEPAVERTPVSVEPTGVAGRPVRRTQFYERPPAGMIVDPPPGRTLFYLQSPGVPGATSPTVLSEDVTFRAPVRADEFFSASWLQDPDDLVVIGELVKVLQSPETFGRETEVAHPHDDVFLSYEGRRPQVGERLLLVTVGEDIEGWGHVILPTAIVTVTALESDVIAAKLRKQYGSVNPGNLAIPVARYPDFTTGAAEPVESGAEGELVGFEVEQPFYGPSDRGFISLGPSQVGVGDELVAFMEAREIEGRTERLPPEPIAEMIVVRLGEQTATVRVSNVRHAVLDVGSRVRVARKVR